MTARRCITVSMMATIHTRSRVDSGAVMMALSICPSVISQSAAQSTELVFPVPISPRLKQRRCRVMNSAMSFWCSNGE